MTRLDAMRDRAQGALRRNADLIYRHAGTFRLDTSEWACRFSVRDPAKVRAEEMARLQGVAGRENVAYEDLRLLKVHPDDIMPFPHATIPWDDGTLEVLEWSQASDFTGQRVGTCVLRRP